MSEVSPFDPCMVRCVETIFEYAHKKAKEESEGDVDKYFVAFDYHCKYILKLMAEQTFDCVKNQLESVQKEGSKNV